MQPEITISLMEKEDFLAAMCLKNAEGWNQTISDWEFLFNNNPNLCLVAIIEGKIIATVTAMTYGTELAWIGMMLVQNDFRGRGIGQMLMKSILKRLNSYPAIKLDATPMGYPVYAKLGFVQEHSIYRMTRHATNKRHAEKKDCVLQAVQPIDLPAIAAFDKIIFGVKRQAVLQYLYTQSPATAFFIEKDNNIKGYIMGRPGTNYHQLGPLLADSTATAIDLISSALSQHHEQPIVVDVLADKEEMITWLQSQGFTSQRELIRMYYKNNLFPGRLAQQFLISGPELG